jgi:general secretion pathway protein D
VAAAKLEQISYPAGDLPAGADLALLVRLVEKIVAPQSWNSVGGPGSIRAEAQGTLVVRQTFEVHEQVCRLLAGLREATKP